MTQSVRTSTEVARSRGEISPVIAEDGRGQALPWKPMTPAAASRTGHLGTGELRDLIG